MPGKYYSRMAAMAALLYIFYPSSAWSQNNYPATGDALIHGLTIGTGNGAQLSNTALGDSALFYNKGGINNTAAGRSALLHNSSGTDNSTLGFQTLYSNSSGGYNLAAGNGALLANNTGSYNIGLGIGSLTYNTSGSYNSAIGAVAMEVNTTGLGNTAVGTAALGFNTIGSYNAGIGDQVLVGDTTASYNTGVGSGAIAGYNPSNATGVGNLGVPSVDNSVIFGNHTSSIGGYAAWTNFSDGRYKKNVSRNVPGLSFINKLEPVTYTLDVDGIRSRLPTGRKYAGGAEGLSRTEVHTGFIAQDVERTAQSVNYVFSGVDKPRDDQRSFYGLRYSDFVVPLVKAFQELSAENDLLKAANARLSSQLDQIEQLLGIGTRQTKN